VIVCVKLRFGFQHVSGMDDHPVLPHYGFFLFRPHRSTT